MLDIRIPHSSIFPMSDGPAIEVQPVLMHPRSSRSRHREFLRNVRDQLPITKYLECLHAMAMTGCLPVYEPAIDGRHKLTGEFTEPDRKTQVETLKYLVGIALSPIAKDAPPPVTSAALSNMEFIENAARLTSSELVDACKGLQVGAPIPAVDPAE